MSGKTEEYEIKASNGRIYRITGSEQQAHQLMDWVEGRIAAGDPDFEQPEQPPLGAQIVKHPRVDGVTYNKDGQIDRSSASAGLDAFLRGGTRAVMSNFADEMAAAANTVVPMGQSTGTGWTKGFGQAFDDNLDLQHQIDEADDSQHPFLAGTGKVGGAVLQALLGGKALGMAAKGIAPLLPKAAIGPVGALSIFSKAAPIRTATAVGAGGGGLSGMAAGAGEGDDLETRMKNAKVGLFTGTLLGGAVAPLATVLAPAIARYGSVLFGRAPEKEATRQLIQALGRDGYDVTSPSGVAALKQELSSYLGKPVSLADIGNATRARAGVGLRAPSDVQTQSIDKILQRQRGQSGRILDDIKATVAPRTDVHALDEALVAERENAAMPLRDKALFTEGPGFGNPSLPKEPLVTPTGLSGSEAPDAGLRRSMGLNPPEAQPTFVPATVPEAGAVVPAGRQAVVPQDPQLQQLARLPFAQKAMTAARDLAQQEVSLRSVLGQDISHLPDVNASGADLDMRTFDYLKRFLDKEVSALKRGMGTDTFKAAEYGQVKDLRNALRDRMRRVQPDGTVGEAQGAYGDYLDAYSGTSDMIDALHAGRGPVPGEPSTVPGFDKLDPERIIAQQGKRSLAAQELYRVGAARRLQDVVNDTGDTRNAASRILTDDADRSRLLATGVSPENAAQLNRSLDVERRMNLLPAELSGSKTAARISAAQDADAGVSASLPFNPGSPIGWLGAIGRKVLDNGSVQRNAAVNEALLPRLLETDPAAIAKTIGELETAGKFNEAAQLRRSIRTYLGTTTLGNLTGSAAARPNLEGN